MCIMNCGLHFVNEVAKDLASQLIADFVRNATVFQDARTKSLEIIQILATAFLAAKNPLGFPNPPEYQAVIDMYNALKAEGGVSPWAVARGNSHARGLWAHPKPTRLVLTQTLLRC
jgi:hypothetical protein